MTTELDSVALAPPPVFVCCYRTLTGTAQRHCAETTETALRHRLLHMLAGATALAPDGLQHRALTKAHSTVDHLVSSLRVGLWAAVADHRQIKFEFGGLASIKVVIKGEAHDSKYQTPFFASSQRLIQLLFNKMLPFKKILAQKEVVQ